jgi:hypothetical protein
MGWNGWILIWLGGQNCIKFWAYFANGLWWEHIHVICHMSSTMPASRIIFHALDSMSGNISSTNMYMNVCCIPWFAGLILYIYRSATRSHFKPGLLKRHLWLDFSLTYEALFMKFTAYWSSRIEALPDFRTSRVREFRRFPIILKQTTDSRTEANSAIIFAYRYMVNKMYVIHQDLFMNVSLSWNRNFHLAANLRTYSRFRQIRRFESEVFSQFPNKNKI